MVANNKFIATALAEKISALITGEYLEKRAKRGSRTKFEKAMVKVADVEADEDEYDRL
jgi:hypothetical protein